jgi:23S rRNA (cytidine1920-2'-O)/16S rRNA (cytidine1409-2'-O)-methyltransferase
VRDPALRRETLVAVGAAALAHGAHVRAYHSSGLPGPKGNLETFVWLSPALEGPRQEADAIERLAREVEP